MGNSSSRCVLKKELSRTKGRVGNGGGKALKWLSTKTNEGEDILQEASRFLS